MLTLVLAASGAFAAGYLTRRWHRPVGHHHPHAPLVLQSDEWQFTRAGGQPYVSVTLRGRGPAPDVVREILRGE